MRPLPSISERDADDACRRIRAKWAQDFGDKPIAEQLDMALALVAVQQLTVAALQAEPARPQGHGLRRPGRTFRRQP